MSDQEAWWLNIRTLDFERESGTSNPQGEELYFSCQCLYSTHVPLVTSSEYHRVFFWQDPTDCHGSQKASALFKSDDLIKRLMISRQDDVDTHWMLQNLCPIICDDSSTRKRWVLINALNYCPVSCDVYLTSGPLIRSLRHLCDRLIVYAIGQSSVIFTVQSSKHVKYISKSIVTSRKFVTRLLWDEKRNLIIDFFRHVIDEVMGWNLIWRTLRRFVFSVMCSDLVAYEVREYDRNGHNSIFFLLYGTHSTSQFEIYCSDFFRRHTKYRAVSLPLMTELVSDYLLKTMSKTTLILVKMSWSAMPTDMRRRRNYLGRSTHSYLTHQRSKKKQNDRRQRQQQRHYTTVPSGVFEDVEHEHAQTFLDELKESKTDKLHESRYDESNSCSQDKQELRIVEGTTHEKHWSKTSWSVIDVSRWDLDSITIVRRLRQKAHIMKRCDNYCKRCENYVATTQMTRSIHPQMQLQVGARSASRIIGGAQEISLEWSIAAVDTNDAS